MIPDPNLLGLAAGSATALTLVLFLRAVWHKGADFTAFLGFVADYRLLPERLAEPAARALVLLEVGAAVLLVPPATRPAGAALATGLLLLYAGAIGLNLLRGRRRVECGCGGPGQALSPALLLRNLVLSGLAALPILHPVAAMDLGEAAASVACGLLLFLLLLLVEQLLANDGHVRLIREDLRGGR